MTSGLSGLRRLTGMTGDAVIALSVAARKAYYQLGSGDKPRVLIHTDSRGHEITSRWNKKNPLSSAYALYFIKNYNTDCYICPENHTTLVDFIDLHEKLQRRGRRYDLIVLHTGVVDFARRQRSSVEDLYVKKRDRLLRVFTEDELSRHLESKSGYTFEGEPTLSLYSPDMGRKLANYLRDSYDNLYWIGCNRVLPDWNGNYWRKRPEDSFVISEYSEIFEAVLPNVISLLDWSDEDIKRYTCDNVHPNEEGFSLIRDRLTAALQ